MDNIILQKTWVQGCPVIVDNLLGTAFTGEAQAHTFVVSGVDAAQEPVTITGTITGKFLAANNVTVPLTGSLVNGAASVTLTDECYDVPGRYILSIYATNGETTQCLYCAVGNVFRTDSQTIAYPSTDLPNITTLMAQLEEILDGWPADYSQLQSDVSNLKSAIEDQRQTYNIFQIAPYFSQKTRGNPTTINGITYTVQANGEILLTGTATANSTYYISGNAESQEGYTELVLNPGKYILWLEDYDYVSNYATVYGREIGTTQFTHFFTNNKTVYTINSAFRFGIAIRVLNNTVIPEQGILIKPMIYYADSEFYGYIAPWASLANYVPTILEMTNELEGDVSELQDKTGKISFIYNGGVVALGYSALTECTADGWYRAKTDDYSAISDLPDGISSGGFLLIVYSRAFGHSANIYFVYQEIHDNTGSAWVRILSVNNGTVTVAVDWIQNAESITTINQRIEDAAGAYRKLSGKVVAIIGDSISTLENENAVEITVTEADVGVELSAYLTYNDVNMKNLSLGGHTFTSSEIGTEVTFTPLTEDIGKTIGWARNYNPAGRKVWWKHLEEKFGCTVIPVCWSGADITSHRKNVSKFENSYAWHPSQIRKCGIRTPGTMNRTAPDVVIIARGGSDFHHTPYAKITSDYFNDPFWTYPEDDVVSGGYGFLEGYAKTVQAIRIAYPNAQIIFCTCPIIRPDDIDSDQFVVNNGANSLQQFNKATREAADFFGCGVINFDKDGVTFENAYSGGFVTDSATNPVHPNNLGHSVMAKRAILDIENQYNELT